MAEGAQLHRRNSGLSRRGNSPVAERAVKAESVQFLAIRAYPRRAIDVEKNIRAGMDRMGKRDGLLRRLVESEYRKRKIEPRRDDEDGNGHHDARDGQSSGRDDRD